MSIKRAILLGRFQPFHLGHLAVIKQILSEQDELVIGIGSAQASHTEDNPFTAGERIMMITKSLDHEGIPRDLWYLIPLVDVGNNSLWVSHVRSIAPPFKTVYSGNPLVKRLFKEAGFDVREPPPFNRSEYSGTEIRKKMFSGGKWEASVPEAVTGVIREIGGLERMLDLRKSEKSVACD